MVTPEHSSEAHSAGVIFQLRGSLNRGFSLSHEAFCLDWATRAISRLTVWNSIHIAARDEMTASPKAAAQAKSRNGAYRQYWPLVAYARVRCANVADRLKSKSLSRTFEVEFIDPENLDPGF